MTVLEAFNMVGLNLKSLTKVMREKKARTELFYCLTTCLDLFSINENWPATFVMAFQGLEFYPINLVFEWSLQYLR